MYRQPRGLDGSVEGCDVMGCVGLCWVVLGCVRCSVRCMCGTAVHMPYVRTIVSVVCADGASDSNSDRCHVDRA